MTRDEEINRIKKDAAWLSFAFGLMGLCLGAMIMFTAHTVMVKKIHAEWRQIIVDNGCGYYDEKTGDFKWKNSSKNLETN